MADKKLIIGLEVNAGNSISVIEKLRDAAVKFGDDGAKHADVMTRSLQATVNAVAAYDRKLSETGNVGERDVTKIIRAFEALKQNTEKAFGSLAAAPKELQTAIAQAEAKIGEASVTVGKLNNAVRDNKAHVEAAANQWSGLKNSLEGMGGSMGAVVGKFGLVTAAFSEGWQIGMKLNKLFGTDVSLWEEAIARLGSKAGAIIRALSDNVAAVINLVVALFSGNMSEVKRALSELRADVANTGKTLVDVATKSGAEWDKLHPTIKQTEDRMKAAKDAAEALAEKKKKLAEEIAHVVRNLKEENEELNKQKRVAEDAKLKAFELGGDVGYLARALGAATDAAAKQRDEVEKLTQRYGLQDPITVQARERLEDLDRQLRSATTRYEETNSQLQVYQGRQKDAEQAAAQLQEKIAAQTAEQKKLVDQQKNVGKSTSDVTTATQAHATAMQQAESSLTVYRDAHGRVHIEMKKVADVAPSVAAGFTKIEEVVKPAGEAMSGAVEKFVLLHTHITGINAGLKEFLGLVPAVKEGMGELGSAAGDAAGVPGSGPHLSMAGDN